MMRLRKKKGDPRRRKELKKKNILLYKVFYLISVSVSLFDKRCVLVKLSCNRKNNNLLLFCLCTSIYSRLLNENVLLDQGFGLAWTAKLA